MSVKSLIVGWKVSSLNIGLASLRYRALLPILALDSLEIKSRIFLRTERVCLEGLDVLVIVKSFTLGDFWLAQEAAKLKVPIIFDLCDNIFVTDYGKNGRSPNEIFLLIANVANAIVVTTEPLGKIVREQLSKDIPIYVIPDGIETPDILLAGKKKLRLPIYYEYFCLLLANGAISRLLHRGKNKIGGLKSASNFGFIRRFLRDILKGSIKNFRRWMYWRYWAKLAYRYYDSFRAKGRKFASSANFVESSFVRSTHGEHNLRKVKSDGVKKRIVWFGNHGAPHASFGILDLLIIRDALEKLATEFSLELVVVSNNYEKYNKYIRPFAIPSQYVEWDAISIEKYLRSAYVVVIPNSLDAFSVCKSSNRTVLALYYGAPVVATLTPALLPLKDCIELDDFEGGLRRYLSDGDYAKVHVNRGRTLIEKEYGQPVIGQSWFEVLNKVIADSSHPLSSEPPELVVAIQLPQDIDLAQPIVDAAKQQDISCEVWTSLAAVQRWPQLMPAIRKFGVGIHIFPDTLSAVGNDIFPASVCALLSVTETNLNPHQFTHQLTKYANAAGIFTATVQHGYENVGLTYSDDIQNIGKVKFASRRIYTWGHIESLHSQIESNTQKKCYPVGCPKKINGTLVNLDPLISLSGTIVGIFENLHWHRYSDEYRNFFIDSVLTVANLFPEINFLIKPHNAGMWLTQRYKGVIPQGDNILIIDPKEAEWSNVTAAELLGHLQAVITTPSTVALDAARIGIPTAVVAHEINLDNYRPLPLINDIKDWKAFISQLADINQRKLLKEKSLEFVDRVLLPGDAAWRIVEDISTYRKLK